MKSKFLGIMGIPGYVLKLACCDVVEKAVVKVAAKNSASVLIN